MLPRIAHLAQFSADRKTKIAAAEFLHSIITLMAGRSFVQNKNSPQNKSSFYNIFRRVLPIMLRISVDIDKTARSLFEALTKQIIYWLANDCAPNSSEVSVMLDACYDAATSEDSELAQYLRINL
eukprot:jgi/Hompol1/1859/HPOL_005752-RA